MGCRAQLFTAMILLLLNVGVFGLILLTTLLSAGHSRVVLVGWVCVGFAVSVFVAPLSIIVSRQNPDHLSCVSAYTADDIFGRLIAWLQSKVVRTRSVEFMPFFLSLSLTVSAVVWFLYGLFIKDKYVAVSNL